MDLTPKCKTQCIKLLENNIRENLRIGNGFCSTEKTISWTSLTTNFHSVKDNEQRMTGQAIDWEKIFAEGTSDKELNC